MASRSLFSRGTSLIENGANLEDVCSLIQLRLMSESINVSDCDLSGLKCALSSHDDYKPKTLHYTTTSQFTIY